VQGYAVFSPYKFFFKTMTKEELITALEQDKADQLKELKRSGSFYVDIELCEADFDATIYYLKNGCLPEGRDRYDFGDLVDIVMHDDGFDQLVWIYSKN
jgi:hypothetical protein